MRKIILADDLRIRFPLRSSDFDEGFEVGMLAALMSMKDVEFTRTVSTASVDQAAGIAEKLGYYLAQRAEEDGLATVTFRSRRSRPKLRIVHSAARAGAAS